MTSHPVLDARALEYAFVGDDDDSSLASPAHPDSGGNRTFSGGDVTSLDGVNSAEGGRDVGRSTARFKASSGAASPEDPDAAVVATYRD